MYVRAHVACRDAPFSVEEIEAVCVLDEQLKLLRAHEKRTGSGLKRQAEKGIATRRGKPERGERHATYSNQAGRWTPAYKHYERGAAAFKGLPDGCLAVSRLLSIASSTPSCYCTKAMTTGGQTHEAVPHAKPGGNRKKKKNKQRKKREQGTGRSLNKQTKEEPHNPCPSPHHQPPLPPHRTAPH